MLRAILISAVLLSGAFFLTEYFVGYPRAGKQYITEQREKRKSIRPGMGYYGYHAMRGSGSRGFRGGK